jgi:Cu-Zn family superoxide dismutase
MRTLILGSAAACAVIGAAQAQELRVTMNAITAEGIGEPLGTVLITQTPAGAEFVTELRGLPPGEHGFHLHEKADCGPAPNAEGTMAAGMAAGSHWDPQATKAHHGPEGQGHLGDLPLLVVQADGSAKGAAMAPRITDLSQLAGKSLMIHAGGDNYSDQPKPLGGGGARIACGVIGQP